MSTVAQLKEEWRSAQYTPPADDTAHLLAEDDPDYEPFELSATYEDQQCRELIEAARFPTSGECLTVVQDWCRRANLAPSNAPCFTRAVPVDACADALHAHPALVYESIARLFYSSFTDDDKSKARAVGVELNEKGGMPLMWVVYYGFSQVVKEMETEASGRLRWASAFYHGVSHAWEGVGNW